MGRRELASGQCLVDRLGGGARVLVLVLGVDSLADEKDHAFVGIAAAALSGALAYQVRTAVRNACC